MEKVGARKIVSPFGFYSVVVELKLQTSFVRVINLSLKECKITSQKKFNRNSLQSLRLSRIDDII